jgi:NADH-quinone oxidoreductase subunit E
MSGSDALSTIFEHYPRERRHSLAILMDIQHQYNYIPKEALIALAEYLDVKVASLYAMATFYRALSLKPKGKHIIKLCDGTACHLRGTPVLLDTVRRVLKISAGETSKDGIWSLETVNCLGACALAPVMVVDGEYHPKVKPDQLKAIFTRYEKAL